MVLKRRHLIKSVTWRICATLITMTMTMVVTGDIKIVLMVGPVDFVIKIILYYLHERAWVKNRFGITATNNNDQS